MYVPKRSIQKDKKGRYWYNTNYDRYALDFLPKGCVNWKIEKKHPYGCQKYIVASIVVNLEVFERWKRLFNKPKSNLNDYLGTNKVADDIYFSGGGYGKCIRVNKLKIRIK